MRVAAGDENDVKKTEMSGAVMARLVEMQTAGALEDFYRMRVWKNKRAEILRRDHWQCQRCGKVVRGRGAIVHHVRHLADRPDLALSDYDESGARQLVTVCKECHEALHPEALRVQVPKKPLTAERWE